MKSARSIALASAGLVLCACEPLSRDLGFDLILPEDSSDYESADNASIVIEPDQAVGVWEVDGLDFTLQVEVEPSTDPRTLTLYLAEGEDLIAWGRSGQFITAGADVGIAIFLGRPGRLSLFPGAIETPDADMLATNVPGLGMLSLTTDGTTALLGQYDYLVVVGSDLEDPPPPDDGDLFGDPAGGALRLAFESVEGWSAFRFDAGADRWDGLTVEGGPAARPGAVALPHPDGERVLILGGTQATDGLEVALLPDDDRQLAITPVDGFSLDAPRPSATATWVAEGIDEASSIVVFGGADPDLPAVFVHPRGASDGPVGPWTGAACVQLDAGDTTPRVLCAGGLRDGQPTADAVLIALPAGQAPDVSTLPDLLTTPMADPTWLEGPSAVYAQGEGRLIRVARGSNPGEPGQVTEVDAPSIRANGGRSVLLDTGATFLTGGRALDGTPVDRWEVFLPRPDDQPAQ